MIEYVYTFKQNENTPTRFDVVNFNTEYDPVWKPNRDGVVWIYKQESSKYRSSNILDTYSICTRDKKHISALKFHSLDHPSLAFGDAHLTNDLLLFEVFDDEMTMYVIPNHKHHSNQIYTMFCNGELDDEIRDYWNEFYQDNPI